MSAEVNRTPRSKGGSGRGRFMAAAIGLSIGGAMACGVLAENALALIDERPEEIAGRWRKIRCNGYVACDKSLYDITPCAESWCGVIVENDGECGRTAIRLAVEKPPRNNGGMGFIGQYSAADDAAPYVIGADLTSNQNNRALSLMILGHSGGQLNALRDYPLHIELEWISEPSCRGEAKIG